MQYLPETDVYIIHLNDVLHIRLLIIFVFKFVVLII